MAWLCTAAAWAGQPQTLLLINARVAGLIHRGIHLPGGQRGHVTRIKAADFAMADFAAADLAAACAIACNMETACEQLGVFIGPQTGWGAFDFSSNQSLETCPKGQAELLPTRPSQGNLTFAHCCLPCLPARLSFRHLQEQLCRHVACCPQAPSTRKATAGAQHAPDGEA